jgi:Protein of unknown function (DUF2631)
MADVALEPRKPGTAPGPSEEHQHEHPEDSPETWGWHGQWGRTARIAGIVVCIILLLMITTTHYNEQGTMWLCIFTGLILLSLLYDRQRRKFIWRK